MCRFRVSLFQAKILVTTCRNLLWNEKPLSESQIRQLVDALEDTLADIETAKRRRWVKRWNRRLGVELGNGTPDD